MSDIDNKARHEVLRGRLAFFGFTRTKVFANPIEDWELHGAQMAVVATNPDTSDYDAYCDVVERALAPFERAYHLGRRDEATAAAKRVWAIQEKLDTTGLDDKAARKCADVLEDAAFAAGGQYFFGFDTDPVTNPWQTPWSAAEPGMCGCARCVDERATAERSNGVSFAFALGSMGRMIVCETCGNKRCPHASFHGNACTFSNDPGQPGSRYNVPEPLAEGETFADRIAAMVEEAKQ